MINSSVRCVIAGTLPVFFAVVAHADVTFQDTEFAAGAWGFETAVLGTGGTSVAAQISGGNPGFARQMTNTVNAGGTIYGFNRFGNTTGTRYDPAVDGEIGTVDFSIDVKWLSGVGGQGQSIALGAKQGQTLYFASYDVTGSTGLWESRSGTGLTAASFQPLTTGSPIDFSATGAPIRFGFVVGNSAVGAGYTNVAGYDNFRVVVHSIPSPAAAGGLGLAACMIGVRRRRSA